MPNYRPATAADVGRTDVEFSDDATHWIGTHKLISYVDSAPYKYATPFGAYRYARVPILPEECEPSFDGVQALHAQVTIRRKLEAGGLAEPEQAVLIDGRFYALDWIKSGVGVLPQQVEIV